MKYTVYLHVFPDKKKYVGCTSLSLRDRWDGGLGYANQKRMFAAILKFGWDNIEHFVLFDGLDEKDAHIIEASLIREWKTFLPSKGYNTVIPRIDAPDEFIVPDFTKTQIIDNYSRSIRDRWDARNHGCSAQGYKCKPVRLVETGEVFMSGALAARYVGASAQMLNRAAKNPNISCGTCWVTNEVDGWHMEVPAHWEYIEK